jgi:hypothetical protein
MPRAGPHPWAMLALFHLLVAVHIIAGATGLVTVWLAIASRKGGRFHRTWGEVFCVAILTAGCCAIGLAGLSLIDPIGTHPHVKGMDAAMIRDLFGWMMLYLGVLTVGLVVHGRACLRETAPGGGGGGGGGGGEPQRSSVWAKVCAPASR